MKPRVRMLPKTGDNDRFRVEWNGRVAYACAWTVDAIRHGTAAANWLAVTRAVRRLFAQATVSP
jgi:hypothetical protein